MRSASRSTAAALIATFALGIACAHAQQPPPPPGGSGMGEHHKPGAGGPGMRDHHRMMRQMMMGRATMTATDKYVYVLRGNTLYQFSTDGLKLVGRTELPKPEPRAHHEGKPPAPGK